MKRKLQVSRVQKCIIIIGAKSAFICVGRQTTPSELSLCRAKNRILRKSGSTFRHGTVFAQKQCLYKNETTGMCANTSLTCAGRQTTPSHVRQYKAENGNLRKFAEIQVYHSPKQCLYQKEATGMESPKMHFSCRCKKRTYLCGTANYPVSCKAV